MTPRHAPLARRDDVRMLTVETCHRSLQDTQLQRLLDLLRPGDVLIVNDAATLPASLHGRTASGQDIELRLVGQTDSGTWRAVVFGAGDWHTPTEHRPSPPILMTGDVFEFDRVHATVVSTASVSNRLIEVRFDRDEGELWEALYRVGKPVQYSYLRDALALWSVQTVFGGRPWAVEMPSAGRPLTWSLLLALRQRGVVLASITHAAGLSSTGDPAIDRMLPLPERYEIPPATVRAIATARASGRRVIAVGTTVVRAVEGSAATYGTLTPGVGITDLVIDDSFEPKIVDGLLTGVHNPSESHFRLLTAFADENTLRAAWHEACRRGYRHHEFGDTMLILSACGPRMERRGSAQLVASQ